MKVPDIEFYGNLSAWSLTDIYGDMTDMMKSIADFCDCTKVLKNGVQVCNISVWICGLTKKKKKGPGNPGCTHSIAHIYYNVM